MRTGLGRYGSVLRLSSRIKSIWTGGEEGGYSGKEAVRDLSKLPTV